jgi:hypothetical protein
VLRLSALSTGRLYPKKYSLYSFLLEAESPQGHSTAGRIMSMKNSVDTIGNRTRDLPTCSSVPQPTALPRVPPIYLGYLLILLFYLLLCFLFLLCFPPNICMRCFQFYYITVPFLPFFYLSTLFKHLNISRYN